MRKASEVSKVERAEIAKVYAGLNDRQNLKEYNRLVDLKMKHANNESDELDELDLRIDILMYI